ncbi:DUF6544 family protein [Haliangium ochraceum]|uniref:Uncharacterized protein n=1 Tax=Haliangium ochraceum (strain DSM 14365 / JCM 11303 / SMP-2) TaxID=502025 RepID=D0LU91_HALO1|nr:DUF6544 family protein [Haliangium ochraceum]ACY17455.1 conserved hypothetical protein [Haliangium ochraceum DSM 14365]
MLNPALAYCEPINRRRSLPASARTYLNHAISPGARTEGHGAIEVLMHGEMKRNGRWLPFCASEWLDPERGLEWQAELNWGPARIRGRDRLIDGRGETQWRLFDRVSLTNLSGPDIARHIAGRAAFDVLWTPGWLASDNVMWTENDDGTVRAQWRMGGETIAVDMVIDPAGQPRSARTMRWGNPDGQGWRPIPFGARIEDEYTHGDFTVPTRMSVGWWFGEDRFEREGMLMRVQVDDIKPLAD